MKKYVMAKTQVEFFHCWPAAPEPVAFLRTIHRHMLHVSVTMEVKHNDREVEIIMLKNQITNMLTSFSWAPSTSCEMVGEQLITDLKHTYGKDRYYKVEVLEDGENGAVIEEEAEYAI